LSSRGVLLAGKGGADDAAHLSAIANKPHRPPHLGLQSRYFKAGEQVKRRIASISFLENSAVSKPRWLRSLIVPAGILSILFVAFVGYYMYWVPSRQRLLDDRGFRYLKTLSDQIRLSVNTYDKMMDNAIVSGVVAHSEDGNTLNEAVTRKNLEKFLKNVAPQLTLADEAEIKNVINTDYDDPPKIAVRADEGTHFLYFAFSHDLDEFGIVDKKSINFAVRTDFDQAINRLLGAASLSPFDVVLISQGDGRVIFQKSLSGVEISQLSKLQDASGDAKGKEKRDIDIAWLSPASRQEEIWIAGARYRLYSQPLQVGFIAADPTGKRPAAGPETWVLCGLVRADRFRSESQLIPYSYILTMLAVILLAAASYPFLKLYLTGSGERLRTRDVTLVAVFACIIAAVLTFIFCDVYFWNQAFGPTSERDMARLAHAINANFKLEQAAAMSALDKLSATEDLRLALQQSDGQSNRDIRVLYSGDGGTCEPAWACRVDMLADEGLSEPLAEYPYPFFAFWSDAKGQQRIKWTTRKRPTPFIRLDDPSVPYYPQIKRALKRQQDSQAVPTQGIGSQYSPTTGQNITTFWKVVSAPMTASGTSSPDPSELRHTAGLVTQPISVYNAVLPGGYQFAVLSPDGTVVYHSDTTRNLRENFFAEAGQNPDLRSRVRMRSEGPVTATYIGRPHRMYVVPMAAGNQDGLWTIVIFRDLHLEEVLNLEILSLVTILFVSYVALALAVMVGVHLMRKGKAARWFWPDSRKAEHYRRIFFMGLGAILLLLLLSHFLPAGALLLVAGLIPIAGLVSAVIIVGARDEQSPAESDQDPESQTRWQSEYFRAATVMVALVAVLPCLCFFKLAADYGQCLLVKRNLLQLAGDLDNRALIIESLYQDVKFDQGQKAGVFRSRIFAGPEGQHAAQLEASARPSAQSAPVFSYHELLAAKVSNDGRPPAGSTVDTSDESSLLSSLSYPYNESAADDRHLAEGGSDVWQWSSMRAGRDRLLTVTKLTTGGTARRITVTWRVFDVPWLDWRWLFGAAIFVTGLYWLVRLSFTRIFLLGIVVPPLARSAAPELDPATLMADLPMNLLIIGPDSNYQISSLLHRQDVQVRDAGELLLAAQPAPSAGAAAPASDPIDDIIRDGRPLVVRDFERLPDKDESAARAHAALIRIVSALGNSVILVSDLDPVQMASFEASDRWRTLLHSFVRIDLHTMPRQLRDEDDADYQSRISTGSYFHWLFAGLPRNEKLIMLQLAKEKVVNPNSYEVVYELLEQGLIERKHGLLTVTDPGFRRFLPHALPHHTVKLWEKESAGQQPFSLQTSLLIVGVGVVAFLVYTQGDVFNTWVTYATGVAAAVPKALQFFENFQSKSASKS
jgi:hypothetical protein